MMCKSSQPSGLLSNPDSASHREASSTPVDKTGVVRRPGTAISFLSRRPERAAANETAKYIQFIVSKIICLAFKNIILVIF